MKAGTTELRPLSDESESSLQWLRRARWKPEQAEQLVSGGEGGGEVDAVTGRAPFKCAVARLGARLCRYIEVVCAFGIEIPYI